MSVKQVFTNQENPVNELKAAIRVYVKSANYYSAEYLAIMTSTHADIVKYTEILSLKTLDEHAPLKLMKDNLDKGIQLKYYKPCDTMVMVKMLWTSLYGFTLKTIIEACDETMLDELINEFIDFILGQIIL